MLSIAVILVLSYLIGSVPSSVWLGKLVHGVDVRDYGSGNAGATNAFRVLGWKVGSSALLLDMGKGALAAGVFSQLRLGAVPSFGAWELDTVIMLLAGLAAIVGHIFPLYLGFDGGKGVATTAGVLLAVTPLTMLIVMAIFVAVLLPSGYVSLASMTSAVAFPIAVAVQIFVFGTGLDLSVLVVGVLLALGIVIAHRSNIRRLMNGEENQFSSFRPAQGMIGRGEL
ncbi:acyl-phosphate glycerol 3-phosphate acyltransferase [Longimonas halophila]|uniref:Glycerol-3-phosphate acyltransferase n=1 Tax=Longimonas halophila TaxID=1469170 RepID=A0A2H3P1I9_9BACT|nr:glycerol-3-phosphate 1-O-acyltransferase PlsY [Longimonas halophila]PEN09440.1 acyl-phosphate glycerol 3-phosphate acyltransferase [Longimonas halophila]